MSSAWENLIKYFMSVCGAGALIWHAIDAWEKRKTVSVKKLEERAEKTDQDIDRLEQDMKDLKADISSQKGRIDGFYDRLVGWLKK